MKDKLVHLGIISIFVSLYFLVATISMINSVAFFDLSHSGLMSWSLAIGFELGAAASLAAIIILDKTNKTMVWSLFLLLTAFQMMANSYHAFVNLEDYMGWIELFGLEEEEPIFQKRILSVVSGAVLPLVALGFIKSLTDYIRPEETVTEEEVFSELDKSQPSDNVAEEINDQPVKTSEKVIEESTIIENNEDDVLKSTVEKKTETEAERLSRLSKTNVHHVEKVSKQTLDSPVTQPGKTERKHYNPKP
jgi:hypothetical protein